MDLTTHQCVCPLAPFTKPGARVHCPLFNRLMTVDQHEVCSDGPYVVRRLPPTEGTRQYFLDLWERERENGGQPSAVPFAERISKEEPGLGDRVEKALSSLGLTKERVEAWVGAPCGCKERQEKLNALGAWASRILKGKVAQAKEYLDLIISE